MNATKTHTITVRLNDDQYSELHQAASALPYDVSLTQIIVRGIHLASEELKTISARTSAIGTLDARGQHEVEEARRWGEMAVGEQCKDRS